MITIMLDGQDLSVITPHIAAGTKDYLSMEIVRGTDWDGLNVHVYLQNGDKTYELITAGNQIGPSAHINLTAGMWSVSAAGYGFADGQLVQKITTNKIGLYVAPAPPEAGSDLPSIPPTSIEQIEAIAQSVRDDADAGLFKGEQGEKGDPGTTDYEELENKPTKLSQFENDSGYLAGVTSVSYETMFGGEFTVTTAADADHEHPWVRTGIVGQFDYRYAYRVTFDGVQYVMPLQQISFAYGSGWISLGYVGDISLYHEAMDGILNEPQDVPFLVTAYCGGAATGSKVDIYTAVPGEHAFLIEAVNADYEQILTDLLYGNIYPPFQFTRDFDGKMGVSVGTNRLITTSHTPPMYAFGNGNVVSGQGACAIGALNEASGNESMAFGYACKASGNYSHTIGARNIASGARAHAEGQRTIASGGCSHVEGDGARTYALGSHVEGGGTYADASQIYTHISGVNNTVSTAIGKTVDVTKYNEDGTVYGTNTRTLGKYAEVIGNGDSDQARSDARRLDWDGNEELAGGLTLGLGTADETHITAAQLKALLALLS